MNIALIGYGKMGKEIEAIALNRNHKIGLIIDINNPNDLNPEKLKTIDVAIEFTIPECAVNNIKKCFEANVPVVCGTTGWLDKLSEFTEICNKEKKRLFHSPNFSLGVNIFFKMNQLLAKIMNNYKNYEVDMLEVHHTQKKDAPSGTAIKLANDLLSIIEHKKKWELNAEKGTEVLSIRADRIDPVPGTHIIKYESKEDVIEITHLAKNRSGFAMGAVLAAEFIVKQQEGIYTMDDLLKF